MKIFKKTVISFLIVCLFVGAVGVAGCSDEKMRRPMHCSHIMRSMKGTAR